MVLSPRRMGHGTPWGRCAWVTFPRCLLALMLKALLLVRVALHYAPRSSYHWVVGLRDEVRCLGCLARHRASGPASLAWTTPQWRTPSRCGCHAAATCLQEPVVASLVGCLAFHVRSL